MKEVLKQVRTKGKVVSEVNIPVYETVDEILAAEPGERIIAMYNNANAVRLMGNERNKFGGTKAGKKKRTMLAFNTLTMDELMAVANNADALDTLLNSDDVQKRVDDLLADAPEGTETGTEEAEVEAELTEAVE